MDVSDIILALKHTSKGQIFNKTKFSNESIDNVHPADTGNYREKFKIESNINIQFDDDEDTSAHDSLINDNSKAKSFEKSWNNASINHSLEQYSFTDLLLQACDEEIDEKVFSFLAKKQKEFEKKDLEFHAYAILHQKAVAEEARRKCLQIEEEERDYERQFAEELENKQKLLKESHHRHAKLLDRKNLEAKSELELRESLKRKQQERFSSDLRIKIEAITQMDRLLTSLVSQSGVFDKLQPSMKEAPQVMKQIVDKIYSSANKGELYQSDVNMAASLLIEAKKILDIIQNKITELLIESKNVKESQQQTVKPETHKQAEASRSTQESPIKKKILDKCSEDYYRLLNSLSESENSFKDLVEDSRDLKRKLSKVVFETMSTLNCHNPDTLLKSYDKFCRLFQGKVVPLPGEEEFVSIESHPSARLFCMSRLARKFLLNAELTKSPENTRSLASLVSSIWRLYPEFGDLFLSHMATKCPFSVPHFGDGDKMSQDEYMRFLGYNITSGEKGDVYLKRMSNIISFYGHVLVSKPFQPNSDSFRAEGIKRAWGWLSMVLTNDPLCDVSAVILLHFLTATEGELSFFYGRQFNKMLIFIARIYLPKIKEVSKSDNINTHQLEEYFVKVFGRKL